MRNTSQKMGDRRTAINLFPGYRVLPKWVPTSLLEKKATLNSVL